MAIIVLFSPPLSVFPHVFTHCVILISWNSVFYNTFSEEFVPFSLKFCVWKGGFVASLGLLFLGVWRGFFLVCVFCFAVISLSSSKKKWSSLLLTPLLVSLQSQESPVLPAGEFSEPFVHFITQWWAGFANVPCPGCKWSMPLTPSSPRPYGFACIPSRRTGTRGPWADGAAKLSKLFKLCKRYLHKGS